MKTLSTLTISFYTKWISLKTLLDKKRVKIEKKL